MISNEGTPLTDVPGWTRAQAKKLEPSWITTAEQVVGVGATPDGVHTLAQQLGVSEKEMHRLLGLARAALPPGVAAELARGVEPGQYGLGALPPDNET